MNTVINLWILNSFIRTRQVNKQFSKPLSNENHKSLTNRYFSLQRCMKLEYLKGVEFPRMSRSQMYNLSMCQFLGKKVK